MTQQPSAFVRQEPETRKKVIIDLFDNYFGHLVAGDAGAMRGKFRKMAESPFAFYRGSAILFYADVAPLPDPFINEQTGRVWIQGDLHAENFGTYMNSAGTLVFDVNDFDEAYVGPFTWDVKRLAASVALIGFQKAMSDDEIRALIAHAVRSYATQVARFASDQDDDFSLHLDNTRGKVHQVLQEARLRTRFNLLDANTEIVDYDRKYRLGKSAFALDDATRQKVLAGFEAYKSTIPKRKRLNRTNYEVKDLIQLKGMGIGSAGITIYSLLLEGGSQALENDLIISIKKAQRSAVSYYVQDAAIQHFFHHDGHRIAESQRALQAHADPLLGHTSMDGDGYVVMEIGPYDYELDWKGINDFDDVLEVLGYLGQCTAKIHCCSDEDSDRTLVPYSIDKAINGVLDGHEEAFVQHVTDFAMTYADQVRDDHRLFVDAFRNHELKGI